MTLQAVILCGGKGTRLSTLYADRPKVLVPVAGRPFLEWQLAWLARGGITQVHLAAGHLASVLQAWVNNQPHAGRLTLSVETVPLGTGGGLKAVEPFIRTDPFLVLNGDSLLPNLDFHAMAAAHAAAGDVAATLAVTPIGEAGRYGTVEFDDATGRITAFREKAQREAGWVNGGVYLLGRDTLAAIPAGQALSLETDLFPTWAARGRLRACPAPAPLLDMGTPEGLMAMERHMK